MILTESPHEATLDKLVTRLRAKYPKETMHRDIEYRKYETGDVIGQIDLLRITRDGTYVMYEVKTGNHKVTHAREQYHRFQKSFPEYKTKGVYVHPEEVFRLK